MAESSSYQQLRSENDSFKLLSPELITNIICQLPSLFDALAFAATCSRHRQIYSNSVTQIYTHVAPKTITCRRDARSLLADQGGAAVDSRVLSVHDVSQLLRNACRVDKAIDQFNRDVVCRIRCVYRCDEFYGTPEHPPQLTRTERIRFIRSYYQLWGCMRLDTASKQSRLESMTLKLLHPLYEIAILEHCIGDETDDDAIQEREMHLAVEIFLQIQRTHLRLHKARLNYAFMDGQRYGYRKHIVMFDHYQVLLREMVCCRDIVYLRRNPVSEFWEETDEE